MLKEGMKRIMACVLAMVLVCSLVSCSATLNGTYTATDSVVKQSFTFQKDNKVQVSAFGVNIEGEYEIANDEITITYSILNLSYDFVKPFEKKGNSIFIDGVEFVKEK